MSSRVLALLLAAVLLLTSCGGDDDAPSDPVAEPSPAVDRFPPDSVLDIAEPEQPDEPVVLNAAYAVVRAEYLMEELVHGLRTSFLDPAIRDVRCGFCHVFVDLSEEASEQEWLFRVDDFELLGVKPRPDVEGRWPPRFSTPVVDLTIKVPEFVAVDVDGEVQKTYESLVFRTRFQATTSDYKTWDVLRFDDAPGGPTTGA